MKYLTPQQILAKIKKYDPDTIFTARNIVNFTKTNNIKYSKCSGRYFIDFDGFLQKLNPKNIDKNYKVPIIRKKDPSVELFNKTHKSQINKHIVLSCLKTTENAFHKDCTLYLINYDLIEDAIIAYLISKKRYVG